MKILALFDFDGTLYKNDSLLEFTRFVKGNKTYYIGLFRLLPSLIALKLRLIHNEKVKVKFLTHFFKDMEVDEFIAAANKFALQKIPRDLNQKYFASFLEHLKAGHTVYIVSASLPEWIAPWSAQYGVEVIGTKIELKENRLTGKLASLNCYGIEKSSRIREVVDLEQFEVIQVYGSGTGDVEMLQLARTKIKQQ